MRLVLSAEIKDGCLLTLRDTRCLLKATRYHQPYVWIENTFEQTSKSHIDVVVLYNVVMLVLAVDGGRERDVMRSFPSNRCLSSVLINGEVMYIGKTLLKRHFKMGDLQESGT